MKGKMMRLRRVMDDGQVHETDIEAMDLGPEHGITFRVDADVEDDDEVTDTLPNGKTKTMRLRDVHVLQNPRGGTSPLDHTGAKYTVIPARAAMRQPSPVTLPGMHPLVSAAAGTKVASQHYDNAVFDAFKAVEDRVQDMSGNPKNNKGIALSGHGLMTTVFNEQGPLLDITSEHANEAQKADERTGYKYMFMGAAQGLRNPRAHGADLKTPEPEGMAMLATASLLMYALDRAEKRQPPKPAKKLPPKSPVPPGFVTWAGGQQ